MFPPIPSELPNGKIPEPEVLREWLAPVRFEDPKAALRCLTRWLNDLSSRPAILQVLSYLIINLSNEAEPDRVLVNFDRLAGCHDEPSAFFNQLAESPRAIDILALLFSASQYLTEILLRNPEYLEELLHLPQMSEVKLLPRFFEESMTLVEKGQNEIEKLDILRRYQRKELLRIGTCDLLDQFDLQTVTFQLSELTDSMVQACLAIIHHDGGASSPGFAVIAMGKLGGRELNYSSDIDLLFVAESDDPRFKRLGERLIQALGGVTSEGFLYRVDMRLRPWGRVGALVPSLDAYSAYLKNQARMWEKQALLKARFVGGDEMVGEEFLQRADAFLFDMKPEQIRAEVFAMKQRTETYLRQKGREWGEVKLGEGSIRDIEFVVQYFQMAFGLRQPEIRNRNTLEALRRLLHYGLLPLDDHRILTDGYVFLRTIEHYLQMMHYRQTYTLPEDPQAQRYLAHRLGFDGPEGSQQFLEQFQQHSQAVRNVYLKFVGNVPVEEQTEIHTPEVRQHLERLDASYEAVFSKRDIQLHASMAEKLNEERLVMVDAVELDDRQWRVTIVAYDYPGELTLICGLMLVYDLDIVDGHVFTYEPLPVSGEKPGEREGRKDTRRKIVDVFTVRPISSVLTHVLWDEFEIELGSVLALMHKGQRQDARIRLAGRVAEGLRQMKIEPAPMYPIYIDIDNHTSPKYTILRIDSMDTVGFLYEFTTALALNHIYIAQVQIETAGQKVHDVLYVTDEAGKPITQETRLRELRAATVLTKHFTHLLPSSSDPKSALVRFREFMVQLFERPDWPNELASLERPEVLNALSEVLGVSEFLWDDFLRMQHANIFPVMTDLDALASRKSREVLQHELEEVLKPVHLGPQPPNKNAAWRKVINDFKDREMFRIDMRHILGHTKEFWEFSQELTDLVEVVVNSVFHLCAEDLRSVHGTPLLEEGGISQMSVVALGKCGGRELGFASDIELMFIYEGNGKTTGPQVISSTEFYEKVVHDFVASIRARREGIFQIDLQLRPYGKAGSLAVSIESFRRYFSPEGPAWPYERQALVKLRAIAGDQDLGHRIEVLRDRYTYSGLPFDVTAMRAMRERQIRHLVKGGTFHPKFSPGGLVDIEYLVQGLQITYGSLNPALRLTNTREGLAALADAEILNPEDYTRLRKALTFFRWLIDSLRVVAGNAKDLVVPQENSEELTFLARRLRYGGDVERLREEMAQYTASVQEINRRLLG